MTEQDYQKKITKALEARGAYVAKVIVGNKKGIPDILACYRGYFLAVEVKTPRTMNNVSPLQQFHLKKINDCGGYSLVAWSVDAVVDMLDEIDEEITTHAD